MRGRDRALDEREVVRALRPSRAAPRGSTRSRPRRRARAARPRSRAARAGSRRTRRTSRRRASACRRAHSSRTASSGSTSLAAVDRAVAADERRAELAVAAVADPALHVALHRDVDPLRRRRRARAAPARAKRIMISGPQTNAVAAPGRSARRRRASATTPTLPSQPASARVDGDVDLESCAASARAPSGRAGRRACGCRRAARPRRSRARCASDAGRATGRSGARPMPPATITTSPPGRLLDRPGVAERPAHAEHRARARAAQIASVTAPDRAHGVHERPAGVAGDRDRHLADPEGVEHRELAGRRRERRRPRRARARASTCRASRAGAPRPGTGRGGAGGERLSRRGHRRRRRGAGAASTAGARSAPARSATSGRSRAPGRPRTCRAGRRRRTRSPAPA